VIIEICVAAITLAFIVLVVFLVITLRRSCLTLKKTKQVLVKIEHDLDHLTVESLKLIKNTNELTIDIKKKSEALNFLFRPLFHLNKKAEHSSHPENAADKTAEILRYLSSGVELFNKIRGDTR